MQVDYKWWNSLKKPEIANSIAKEDDIVFEVDGIAVLVQDTKTEENNIVCFRVEKSNVPILDTFVKIKKLLLAKSIFYIRIAGKYNFILKAANEGVFGSGIIVRATNNKNRNVFYVKLF